MAVSLGTMRDLRRCVSSFHLRAVPCAVLLHSTAAAAEKVNDLRHYHSSTRLCKYVPSGAEI